MQEGKKLNQIEVARNLKKMGLSTDMIVQGTGLSVEEIENLKTSVARSIIDVLAKRKALFLLTRFIFYS